MAKKVQPTQKDVIERTAEKLPEKKVYTPEQFVAMYNRLCQETGYAISAHPEWRPRDDSTYSLVVIMTVAKQASQPG